MIKTQVLFYSVRLAHGQQALCACALQPWAHRLRVEVAVEQSLANRRARESLHLTREGRACRAKIVSIPVGLIRSEDGELDGRCWR